MHRDMLWTVLQAVLAGLWLVGLLGFGESVVPLLQQAFGWDYATGFALWSLLWGLVPLLLLPFACAWQGRELLYWRWHRQRLLDAEFRDN